MDSVMVIKVTEKSMGLLVINEDATREVAVIANVMNKATEQHNQQLMQDIKEVYEKYRSSVRRWQYENSL